jgi:hypothetical protein
MRRFILFFGIVVAMMLSCSSNRPHKPGGPYYFADFADYHVPVKLFHEISVDGIHGRKTYYEAFFDENGRLIRVCKYLEQSRDWEDVYYYSDSGKLAKRVMTKSDGTSIVQHFDEHGRIRKE